MNELRAGVIGVGKLGKEHARILANLPGVKLVGVADIRADQAEAVAHQWQTRAFSDYREMLDQVDAAVVAVPTSGHHDVAQHFLRRGIPLLVEKPLATTLSDADDLVALARRHGTILQVGHVERFNPAMASLEGIPFRPKFIEADRLGPYTFRSTDIGVVLDLMIHDLEVMLALVGSQVRSVAAVGISVFGENEDIANARLVFDNGCVANLTASRLSMMRVRKMRLWGAEGYLSIDFAARKAMLIRPAEKFYREHDRLIHPDPADIDQLQTELYRDFFEIQNFEDTGKEPLALELEHFVHCVRTGSKPKVDGARGRDALALAERVLDSLRNHQWEGDPAGPVGPLEPPAPVNQFKPHFLQARQRRLQVENGGLRGAIGRKPLSVALEFLINRTGGGGTPLPRKSPPAPAPKSAPPRRGSSPGPNKR